MFPSQQITFLNRWFRDTSHAKVESLGVQGGFSGAKIWRVSIPGQNLCLRRWPQSHPTIEGLSKIHGLLRHAYEQGCEALSVPLATRTGESYFVNEDHLWELSPWMPGEANYMSQPNRDKLETAMQTLAQFHNAALSFGSHATNEQEISPGLHQRLNLLRALQQGELEKLWKSLQTSEDSDLRDVALELLEGISHSLVKATNRLEQLAQLRLPQQWCIRDVRHDHLLFTGDRVTGLIDFGAAAIDNVSGDIARLLGSMVNDCQESWQTGIQAYCQIRPLSNEERQAIAGFDEGGVIASAANWVRWLYVEGRAFPQVHALHAQLVWLRNRLQAMAARSIASTSPEWQPKPHKRPVNDSQESIWMHS